MRAKVLNLALGLYVGTIKVTCSIINKNMYGMTKPPSTIGADIEKILNWTVKGTKTSFGVHG